MIDIVERLRMMRNKGADEAADEIERLRERAEAAERERDIYKELYAAKLPLHERRKWPSVATETVLSEAEWDPRMLFQQSFWPDCQCMECYGAHKAEEYFKRALEAERKLAESEESEWLALRNYEVLRAKLAELQARDPMRLAQAVVEACMGSGFAPVLDSGDVDLAAIVREWQEGK